MAKKIAFGCTLLNRGLNGEGIDGIGHYCKELLSRLEKDSGAIEIQRFSFGHTDGSQNLSVYPGYSNHLAKSLLGLRPKSNSIQDTFQTADLIHATDHLVPLGIKKPLIASVMDVIPISHPQFLKSKIAQAKALIWKQLSRRADHIITISEFSKNEIVEHMQYPAEQISAIPLGIDERFFEKISTFDIQSVKNKYGISKPYFLFIGSLQPRKNLTRLIKAHQNLPNALSKEFPLVIVGRHFWDDGTIADELQIAIKDQRCIWLNYVSEWDKRCLLQNALALCFVSLYEGFGLPILEAFASGTPVITSNVTSMPEIAQNAAITVNPLDIDEIQNALLSLINDEALRQKIREAGLIRAQLYKWTTTAHRTQEIYSRLG